MRAIGEELNNCFKSRIWGRLERTVKVAHPPQLKTKPPKYRRLNSFCCQVFVTGFQKPLFLSDLDSKTGNYMKSMEIFLVINNEGMKSCLQMYAYGCRYSASVTVLLSSVEPDPPIACSSCLALYLSGWAATAGGQVKEGWSRRAVQ